jgi:HSP20 family protein
MAEKTKDEGKSLPSERPGVDLTGWQKDMERMLEDFFSRKMRNWWPERSSKTDHVEVRAPAVDLYEETDDIVVKAELPGIEKDKLEVHLTDRSLTIKGEKKKEQEINEENYYCAERSYGSFVRTLELPKNVHTDKVKASLNNGILEVRVPKTEKAKETKVNVE